MIMMMINLFNNRWGFCRGLLLLLLRKINTHRINVEVGQHLLTMIIMMTGDGGRSDDDDGDDEHRPDKIQRLQRRLEGL